jgi:hypothetical protein
MYPPDQVPRLKAFEAAHPDIRVDNPIDSRTGFWSAFKGSNCICFAYDLRQLLDKLERLCDLSRP